MFIHNGVVYVHLFMDLVILFAYSGLELRHSQVFSINGTADMCLEGYIDYMGFCFQVIMS